MADRPKKKVQTGQSNSVRPNGKAPKKHPKQPKVKQRTPEQIEARELAKVKRDAARYDAWEKHQKAAEEAARKERIRAADEAAEKLARKNRLSESQRRRAVAQQAADKIKLATLTGQTIY